MRECGIEIAYETCHEAAAEGEMLNTVCHTSNLKPCPTAGFRGPLPSNVRDAVLIKSSFEASGDGT